MTVSELAELSNLSKSYISQVKHGKRAPSKKLIESLSQLVKPSKPHVNYVALFIKARSDGVSPNTLEFYERILNSAVHVAQPGIKPSQINNYLKAVPGSLGNKRAHFRALRAFFRWLYSPKSGLGLELQPNPMLYVDAPRVPKLILPSLTREQVELLIAKADNTRDKAIIAVLTESGLRLSELASIKESDIDWQIRTIRVTGKGNKEGYAPFGILSEGYLRAFLLQHKPKANVPIWGLKPRGIQQMLESLAIATGLPCNPHTFRRTFAYLLRKAGIDTMTIKDLGRWESLEMVQRYTRSVTVEGSLKFYKAPLSQ